MSSALERIAQDILIAHQLDYVMLTAEDGPKSFCECGAEIVIELPQDRMTWKSSMIEEARINAHTSHQSEMLLKKFTE